MHISIAERLRPFSHVPGTATILPGSGLRIQIYPCLVRISDLKSAQSHLLGELKLNLKGPVEQFTVFNDMEKGRITVSGKTWEGWIRYHLISSLKKNGLRFLLEKAPHKICVIEEGEREHQIKEKEHVDLFMPHDSFEPYKIPLCDRLSLGNHKAQDFELIRRRGDLAEILPLIHRLGQLVPFGEVPSSLSGTLSLFEECRQSFALERPEKGSQAWHRFFMGCFNQLLVPQFEDVNYQGLIHLVDSDVSLPVNLSPLVLLSAGSRLIRKLFIQQESNQLAILPYLLPSLHCGRLLNTPLEGGGWLSMEWTKKTIRRLVIYSEKEREWSFKFRSDVRSYRLRQSDQEKGERVSCQKSLCFKHNQSYLFDNFQ